MSDQGLGCVLGALVAFLTLSSAVAGGLSVQVDRQRLALGEPFELLLSAEGDVQGELDPGPLKQDLEILGQTQSEVTSIINGRISHRRQWRLQLAPKRAGRLLIPSLQVGGERSPPLSLEVMAAGSAQGSRTIQIQSDLPQIFLTAETETKDPYIHQPIAYRVKVYYLQTPQRAMLSDPETAGASIQRIGEDLAYEEVYQGRTYRVIERRYRVIPQRSGSIRIRSPRLEAWVAAPTMPPLADLDRFFAGQLVPGLPDLSGLVSPGQRIEQRADELMLEVRAKPLGSGSPWLPASSVQLTEEWNPDPPVLRLGEPITRILTLTAEGITAAQLPDLDLGSIPGVQIYPDRPQTEDLEQGPRPAAVKTFRFALVPTQPGTLALPEIRVPWWDVRSDRPQVAVLPARTFEVTAGVAATGADMLKADGRRVDEQSEAHQAPSPGQVKLDERDVGWTGATGFANQVHQSPWWRWPGWALIALIFAAGWLLTLWAWQRERCKIQGGKEATVEPVKQAGDRSASPGLERARQAIRTACLAHDPRAARAALLAWGRLRWPDETLLGLDGLAERLGQPEIRPILRAIDGAIYAPPGQRWDGETAWQQLAPYLGPAAERGQEEDSPLPRLYPEAGQ